MSIQDDTERLKVFARALYGVRYDKGALKTRIYLLEEVKRAFAVLEDFDRKRAESDSIMTGQASLPMYLGDKA